MNRLCLALLLLVALCSCAPPPTKTTVEEMTFPDGHSVHVTITRDRDNPPGGNGSVSVSTVPSAPVSVATVDANGQVTSITFAPGGEVTAVIPAGTTDTIVSVDNPFPTGGTGTSSDSDV